MKKDPFQPCKKFEELLGLEVPYLSVIGALMYFSNCTRSGIVFFPVNLLARYSSVPTRRHWNDIKHILHYLCGTTNMSIFYSRESKQQLLGYADAEYLSEPYKEIIAIHEVSRECVWLRSMIQHIQETCGLPSIRGNATVLHEDNVACIAQIKGGFITGDRTKHISLNYSILMSSKRKVRSMFNRFDHAIIWQIYSQMRYLRPH